MNCNVFWGSAGRGSATATMWFGTRASIAAGTSPPSSSPSFLPTTSFDSSSVTRPARDGGRRRLRPAAPGGRASRCGRRWRSSSSARRRSTASAARAPGDARGPLPTVLAVVLAERTKVCHPSSSPAAFVWPAWPGLLHRQRHRLAHIHNRMVPARRHEHRLASVLHAFHHPARAARSLSLL